MYTTENIVLYTYTDIYIYIYICMCVHIHNVNHGLNQAHLEYPICPICLPGWNTPSPAPQNLARRHFFQSDMAIKNYQTPAFKGIFM